ncbi:MAG TPA: alpha-hydroxy-acid oxidizing protein [Candidatus Acidoferrum sp.]|nr:alpha-hydroxy-acid oxidizing protein [Candidatus Acidoferrum sp.]
MYNLRAMSERVPPSQIPSGPERQQMIYSAGLTAVAPSIPVALTSLEQRARQVLSPPAFDYVAGGAGGEDTVRANREAFYRWRIVPRMLRDVSRRELHLEILGEYLPAPVILGPVGVQGILHADAEIASARAAAALGLPFVLSTASSRTMEQVAQAARDAGNGLRWFQLYWGKNPDLTASLLQRAERAGYTVLVVTLDTSMLAWRERDLQHAYLPFILGQGLANYFSDPVFRALLPQPPEQNPVGAIQVWSTLFSNTALTWKDLAFLRQHTRLPIVLKGILHPDDAARALDAGADALIVSNHGGRQVDGAIATLDALPAVSNRVAGKIPVLLDGGIRRGADIFKALALGARAVLLGRLYTWGLAVDGESGVRDVLLNLIADFDLTLALSGYASCRELNPSALCDSR